MVRFAVSSFVDALNNQAESLEQVHRTGRKIIGYFCHYTPIELIHACGFLPIRISGGPGEVDRAYDLAPDFICPYMKRSLEKALSGEYSYLSGLIQGYTCDIACGMANIWAENISGELFHILSLPYNDTHESRSYLSQEYNRLIEKLTTAGGSCSDTSLRHSLALYRSIRLLLRELYDMRTRGQLPLTATELWQVLQAGFVCPPEDYLAMLNTLRKDIYQLDFPDRPGIPVVVSGSLIESPEILDLVESCGGNIVADDLCSSQRSVGNPLDTASDPFELLADHHFNRFPCPSRSRAEDRFPLIRDLIDQSGAKGVIFLFQKFCTPHLCDYPYLSEHLQQYGIPSIMIELEETRQADAQIRTRLEGLFEILGR